MRIGLLRGGVIARLLLEQIRLGAMGDAQVLALAGIGFERARLTVVADLALKFNTHFIRMKGSTGTIELRFENVPSADNPKTAMLACYSALAALRQLNSPVRYGT